MRLSKEQLNAIKEKYGVDELWSFSRANTYVTSPYCYYLKYIVHQKEDKRYGIYSESGALVHNILEKFYNHEIKYEDMIEEYELGLSLFNGLDLQYNKTDVEKNAKIANKYEACIRHFFKNHVVFNQKSATEQFALTVVGPYVFQGYIDFVMMNDDGSITIVDFKTSTIYKGDKALKESKQLLLYAQSLAQHGVPLEKIHIQWDFLKYVKVKYLQKNGTWKERDIERSEIGTKLTSSVKTKLKDAGYSPDEINQFLEQMVFTNDVKCLPEEVRTQFEITDCLVNITLNQEILDSLNKELTDLLKEITKKTNKTAVLMGEKKIDEAEKLWWDDEDHIKSQEYYFYNLCGFSPEIHKPWGAYLAKKKEEEENKDNVFYDVGSAPQDFSENLDLSWLENF